MSESSASPKPSILDTTFFQGMYDSAELISWIEREQYPPIIANRLFPLCITSENVESVFQLIRETLGDRYLQSLEQYVEGMNQEVFEREKGLPIHRHWLRGESIDPVYVEGVRVLQNHIEKHGSLTQR